MIRTRKKAKKAVRVGSVNVPGYSRNLNADMYQAARTALLKVLPRRKPGLTQAEMFAKVKRHLPARLFPGGQKAEWWTKSVQLDLEAKGLVKRVADAKPLRWLKR